MPSVLEQGERQEEVRARTQERMKKAGLEPRELEKDSGFFLDNTHPLECNTSFGDQFTCLLLQAAFLDALSLPHLPSLGCLVPMVYHCTRGNATICYVSLPCI